MRHLIKQIVGRRVWDSRGRPTVEAEVILESGARGRAIAPAGASTGSGEALDMRDGGQHLGGYDVARAVSNVNGEIAAMLIGMDAADQQAVDGALIALDGTPQKSRLGGNSIIAVSMAVLHAAAAASGQPIWRYLANGAPVRIPVPEIQIFGGGAHAGRRVDIQDFLVVCPSARSFDEVMERTANVYRAAGNLLAEQDRRYGVADEGGWWPAFDTNEEALDLLVRSIERAGYIPGDDVWIALDVAASEFGRNGRYTLGLEKRELDRDALGEMLVDWVTRYPILSVEDPFAEDDKMGFQAFVAAVGHRVQVVGDDLLVTDAARVEEAARDRLATCVLIKPNQAGTVTETHAALLKAQELGLGAIVSARSGESEDTTIAHLAVGWNAGQFKVGSITRSERMAKWNEILRIEESLGYDAFAGPGALAFSPKVSKSTEQLRRGAEQDGDA
ncbi:MAG TPA: phosphopyruvate hydratase [Devosia sp.]|jgi:enolase|uniref:phosphopyruvate hydratase n=1 Tax=Devosia sp. TaxID=1871048 RepID=UPI002DDD8F96|nr:phosphopyruvate hydratase [Devosia sp.]HEV2514346.1 phosphopyruvate hydratase [Devosia sp.]